MPQKAKVDALMQQHNCTRTKANNMLRVRASVKKGTDGTRANKRKSVPK